MAADALSRLSLTIPPPALSKTPSPQTRMSNFRYVQDGRDTRIYDSAGTLLNKHDDLWFADGSIIMQAESTLFRVHKSYLSRHSVLFKDIFMLPQPPRSRSRSVGSEVLDSAVLEELESCPVVFLHDKAQDVTVFLRALYDGCDWGNNNRADFEVVSGILRLATKYIVDSLREKALKHISTAWPSTLKGWDAREDVGRAFEMETSTSSGHFYPSPIAVINLAREVDAPSLLSSAFYDLCRYTYSQIYEPVEDEPLHQSPDASPLSSLDMRRLSLGKEAAQHSITNLIQHLGHAQTAQRQVSHLRKNSIHAICLSAAACRKDFVELTQLATQHYLFDRERGHCDPLYVSEEIGQLKSADISECKACARALESWAARERQKIWQMIPVWFKIEIPLDTPISPASPTTTTSL
ncbi:BTB domain-containing protein [Mycena kentingensis (nom. inval.)]|nr:BTB domain-containing protein [Mycena kentingensis (nom. inval.)]